MFLPDLEIEFFLKEMRKRILFNWGVKKLIRGERFLISLSIQCFINEYLYFESEAETRLISSIEEIQSQLQIDVQPDELNLLVLSSYRPLKFDWIKQVKFDR